MGFRVLGFMAVILAAVAITISIVILVVVFMTYSVDAAGHLGSACGVVCLNQVVKHLAFVCTFHYYVDAAVLVGSVWGVNTVVSKKTLVTTVV